MCAHECLQIVTAPAEISFLTFESLGHAALHICADRVDLNRTSSRLAYLVYIGVKGRYELFSNLLVALISLRNSFESNANCLVSETADHGFEGRVASNSFF